MDKKYCEICGSEVKKDEEYIIFTCWGSIACISCFPVNSTLDNP